MVWGFGFAEVSDGFKDFGPNGFGALVLPEALLG